MHRRERSFPILLQRRFQSLLDLLGLRLVIHLEDGLLGNAAESVEGRLGTVQN